MAEKLHSKNSYGVDPDKTVTKLAKKLSWLVAGILVLLPFHALLTTWAGSNFGHLDLWRVWKEILFLLMIVPVAWLVWKSPPLKKWLASSWIARLFIFYVMLHLILGFWAYGNHDVSKTALVYGLIVNLRFIGFFILCAAVSAHSDFLRRHWRKILLLPAAVVITFGLIQKLFLPYDFLRHFGYGKNTIPAYQTVDSNIDYRRIQSTLRGANPLGAYLVLIITVLSTQLRKNLKLFGLFLAGDLVVLFYSYSRSAEIGVIIALVLVVWWAVGKKIPGRRFIFLLVVLAALLGVGIYVFRNSQPLQDTLFHTSNSSAAPRSSNADHLQSMKDGARDIIHQPLGGGPGTAGPASFRNNQPPRIAENYFLQIGQEVGIVGIALFVAINVLVAKELWTRYLRGRASQNHSRNQDQLAKILLASLVGLTFVNLLSHAWTDDTLSYLWWGLAGIALAPVLTMSKKRV